MAWSPTFAEKYGISNAAEIGIACATFGLVLGGIIGGPLARHLIHKHALESTSHQHLSVGIEDEKHEKITVDSVFNCLLVLALAIGIGVNLYEWLQTMGVQLPVFVPCIFGGIILTNTVPLIWKNVTWPTGKPTLALTSEVCLGLFLAMSLMSLQLWTLVELALPIILLLAAQVAIVSIFALFVVYPLLGRSYDAAVMASGYAGLALGATPTAIANMTAVTKRYGAAPTAFIVIPLVGAFFIDIANAVIIQRMLTLLA
ncbi:sodium/glutamate symporter [Thalassotalea euphylliae]|uniref:sodium/glutamate symporter n=1 Tax=Thalassotalea euphylliae TaxID=1655234 RepID=UPI0036430EE5